MIGQSILHYSILEKLGEGGMGVVYKAHDSKLDRPVALKFLPPSSSASEQDKSRFIQEARAASSLNHPNVCTIYDIQEHEGRMFMVMEYVEGVTLREKVKHISGGDGAKTLPLKQAVEIGIQVADGLAAAHEKGIVHRDIKPENIMIRKDGIALIMDFGLAKLRGTVTRLTKEGSTVGTAGYMSPEQIQGNDIDHRSDIFSLGTLLYELFTGELPFRGVHETALAYEIVNVDVAPMSAVNPELEPDLDAIVLECLPKEPDERYQSAKEISKELKRFKRESSRQRVSRVTSAYRASTGARSGVTGSVRNAATPVAGEEDRPVPAGKSRIPWPVLTAVLLLAVVALIWRPWVPSGEMDSRTMHLSMNLPDSAAMNFSAFGTQAMAISDDGATLVYSAGAGQGRGLMLRRLDGTVSKEISGTTGGSDPAFSPDGRWIAFFDGSIRKVSVTGGAAEELCPISGFTRGVVWGDDGYIYFGNISDGILRVNASGGTPERVTVLDTAGGESSHRFPSLLPDGKHLLYTIKMDNISTFDEASIAVMDIATKEKQILIRGGTCARYVPGGYIVYAREGAINAVAFDPSTLTLGGGSIRLFEGGKTNLGSGSSYFAFSKTGVMIYTPGDALPFNRSNIVTIDRSGHQEKVIDESRAYNSAALSPDGKKLALTILAANDDIWIYQIERKTLSRLTFGGGNHNTPVWFPDGKRVFYSLAKRGEIVIRSRVWDGSSPEQLLGIPEPGYYQPQSFTPDGSDLVIRILGGDGDIGVVRPGGNDPPKLIVKSKFDEGTPRLSPDGRWLAYSSNESGRNEIFVRPYPEGVGRTQVSVTGGAQPVWAHSGKELFFVNGEDIMQVTVTAGGTFAATSPRKLFTIPHLLTFSDLTPDDRKFVVNIAEGAVTTAELSVITGWFAELGRIFSAGKQ